MLFPPETLGLAKPTNAVQVMAGVEAAEVSNAALVTDEAPVADTAEIPDPSAVATAGRIEVVDRLAEILGPANIRTRTESAVKVEVQHSSRAAPIPGRRKTWWWLAATGLIVAALVARSPKSPFRRLPKTSAGHEEIHAPQGQATQPSPRANTPSIRRATPTLASIGGEVHPPGAQTTLHRRGYGRPRPSRQPSRK